MAFLGLNLRDSLHECTFDDFFACVVSFTNFEVDGFKVKKKVEILRSCIPAGDDDEDEKETGPRPQDSLLWHRDNSEATRVLIVGDNKSVCNSIILLS